MNRILRKIVQETKNAAYQLRVRGARLPEKAEYVVPYVCQFAHPDHAELSLKKKLAAKDDPHWKETGAISPIRYAEWAFAMCGMASAAMAIDYFKHRQIKVAELAEDAMKHDVYTDEPNGISDMRYRQFSKWIKRHGLHASIYTKLSAQGIRYALAKGKLVIISVNPNIRGYDTAPQSQKGGHLVLATGYDLAKRTMTINNPSGFTSTKTQAAHTLSEADFLKYYAGRGIVVSDLL